MFLKIKSLEGMSKSTEGFRDVIEILMEKVRFLFSFYHREKAFCKRSFPEKERPLFRRTWKSSKTRR
jgi:hypothetical protein